MNVIRMTATSDADGKLRLELPVGAGEYEVAVVLARKVMENGTPESRGWPPGYFENVIGSIDDDTFVAPPRGEYEKREAFD